MPVFVELNDLVIFRSLLEDPVIGKLPPSAESEGVERALPPGLVADLIGFAEQYGLAGNVFGNYLIYLLAVDENIFSITAEKQRGQVGPSLLAACAHDLAILQRIHRQTAAIAGGLLADYQPTVASDLLAYSALARDWAAAGDSPAAAAAMLARHYARFGCGQMANHVAFRWDRKNGLVGITHYDKTTFDDIIGYERQKLALRENTEAFLAGRPANNALLIGPRGTGKSSTVKALVNAYAIDGLRLVEVAKSDLRNLQTVSDLLGDRGKQYIVFLDDLSFEDSDSDFKLLKTVIDGSLQTRPANVLIYATSNRRHLVKETWQDRQGGDDEIHRFDSLNEKIALADRFGLTITFPSPDQQEYLNIVNKLAQKHQVALGGEELSQQALQWEFSHSGRSGRVARQFIQHILGKIV
jgi:Predicted ATPase (AAA+ superfamily)